MEKNNNADRKIYYYKHPTSIYVLYGVFCVCLIAPAIYNVLKVLEVGNLVSYYRNLEIVSIVVCLFALGLVSYFLFFNCYIITDNEFIFRKFSKKVYAKDKLLTIKIDKKSGLIVLYVEDETKEDYVGFIVLSVSKSKEKELIEDITKLNSHVSVETLQDYNE